MDALRRMLATIGKQMSSLTVTQKLLIGSMVVLMLMTMFLVSQYAGAPKMVELIPTGTGEDQGRVAAMLDEAGVQYVMTNSKVTVLAERKYPVLAQLARAHALPKDQKMMFENLVGAQNWLMPESQVNTMNTIALSNELSAIIRNFKGIRDASVIVSRPESKGIGSSYRKPVAQVTLFPESSATGGLDQGTVNALAELVAGAVSGMDSRDVAIIDAVRGKSYRAVGGDDLISGTYMEHVGKVEGKVREKIEDQLKFIQNVIVSVNAIVDASKRQSKEVRALDKGSGTVVVSVLEESKTKTNTNSTKSGPAEPGLASNVGMDINTSGSSGGVASNNNEENSTLKSEARFGERVTTQIDAAGKPTKINVTVSVPREYLAELVKNKKGGGAGGAGGAAGGQGSDPTEQEIKEAWEGASGQDGLKAQLEQLVTPLVETESVASVPGGSVQVSAGTVRAFLIPVATGMIGTGGGGSAGAGGIGGGGGGGGFMSTLSALSGGGIVKTVALGVLAVVALGMMVMMVRKTASTQQLPTAEELVGIPPMLQAGGEIVGEADEGETAMTGIEVDADALKTGKMLEEIGQLVKANPASAAGVFNKWIMQDS